MPKQPLKTRTEANSPADVTKSIKNYSLQGINIILKNGNDFDSIWLSPKQSIRVHESQITQQIKNLHKRRLVIIGN